MAPGRSNPDPATQFTAAADRLDSWKEIASHLRRSVRTVTRWKEELGLPVHRHHTGTVYAYKSELDAWWASRKREIDSEPTSIESPSTAESPPASWLRRYGFQIAGVGLIAVGILA